MKLGEIKIEALKLMFAVGRENLRPEDIDGIYDNEQYSDYLLMMTGALNRCFSVIEERRVLPVKSFGLGEGGRYELGALIPDFFDVERIVFEGSAEYIGDCEYHREGDTVLLKNMESDGEYRVLYKPSIPRLLAEADNELELPIPDRIACYIPYFIKGELFRMDEPDEAAEARNFFESSIAEVSKGESGRQSRVVSKYSVYEV